MIFTRWALLYVTLSLTRRHLQFFMKTSDDDVGRYLKLFTLLPLEHVQEVLEEHNVSDVLGATIPS
jgi:tyrosyl-tRNA synthetase